MNRTYLDRRWPRTASIVLPVIAVGIVVFSLIASLSGGGASASARSRSNGLASLLTGSHAAGKHHRHPGGHRLSVERRSTGGGSAPHGTHRRPYRPGRLAYPVASARDVSLAPTEQIVAILRHGTKGYSGRNSLSSNRHVPGRWYGHPSVLPVIATTQDRLLVRLAQRPNGTTTWINRAKAVLRVSYWAIVVDLRRHFLYAFDHGVQRYAFPVGNGTSRTPTPTGTFFVAFHARSAEPGYGPVNIATSAHSTVFRSFDGGDDAIIGIHGPIGSDAEIGNHGAAISNGCIRMHLRDLAQVVGHVPDGSPVILTR